MTPTTRWATYVGRAYRVSIDGVELTRGTPVEVPQGKLTVLRNHPEVVVADDDALPELPPDDTDLEA
jgi:hypothetical protein